MTNAVTDGKFSFSKWLAPFITMYLAVLSTGLFTYFSFKISFPPLHQNPIIANLQQGIYNFIFISPVIFGYLFGMLWFTRPHSIIRAVVASGILSFLYITFASYTILFCKLGDSILP